MLLKLAAMKRVLSKFGAYTGHLATLSEDSSVKAANHAKLSGYYKKWIDSKYILECAVFVDILTPCTFFSKCMQSDEVDILEALTCLLKTLKKTEKLSSKPLDQWSTYATTLSKCTEEEGNRVYQCQELKHFSETVRCYTSQYEDYCSQVSQCIKSRLSWSDLDLAHNIIFMLSTHGWEKALKENNDMAVINWLVKRFAITLQGAQANTDEIVTEFCEMVSYAMQYISLSVLEYHSV